MDIYKIKRFFERDKKIILLSLLGGMALTALLTGVYSNSVQAGIAENVIRLHVLAESNSEEDQNLKLKVRDAVLLKFSEPVVEASTAEEAREIVFGLLPEIKKEAENVIEAEGFSYDVKASISESWFPLKTYGGFSFPEGRYTALKIEIGSAKGENWWCVMFPPLCFVEAEEKNGDEKGQMLENILPEESYTLVSYKLSKDKAPEIKFKIVEWWQEKIYDNDVYAAGKIIKTGEWDNAEK